MISVILICHNYGRYIQQCFDSIYANNQNLVNEIIVINDSSEDNSSKIIEANRFKNNKIKHFGVEKSNSEYISKIDADDLYKDNFISDFFNHMSKNKLDLVYGNLLVHDEKNGKQIIKVQQVSNFLRLFKYPVGGGTIFKKDLWKEIGGFDEKLKFQDDYDFWLRINKLKNKNIGYFNQVGYVHRKHMFNMSNNLFKKNYTKIKVFLKNY